MNVIKKDGRLQNFDLSKIKTTITRASDDANQPFNVSDIENLSENIEESIKNLEKDTIDAHAIQDFILIELQKSGFDLVAKYYKQGKL